MKVISLCGGKFKFYMCLHVMVAILHLNETSVNLCQEQRVTWILTGCRPLAGDAEEEDRKEK